jgi:hypothetical protein
MKILSILQLIVCLFATSWLATAAYRGWKAGPTAGGASGAHRGSHYSGIYYGGPSYSGGSRSSGGSWGGGK